MPRSKSVRRLRIAWRLTSTRPLDPCPARRASEGSASHGGSRVHPLLTHAPLEERPKAPHRMAAHEYTPPLDPCPARRASEGSASHGGSRVHPLLTHAPLEERP